MVNLLSSYHNTLQKKTILGHRIGLAWFFLLLLIISKIFSTPEKRGPCVVLHTTTSFTDPGRICNSFCERDSITKLMRSIANTMNQSPKQITTIVLTKPGNREPVDTAQLVNHLKPDVCFIFSAYKTENSVPECGIYWYTWSSSMVFPIKGEQLIFVSEADAYRISHDATLAYVQKLKSELTHSMNYWASVLFGSFPLAPLRGIIVPAFLIEIGLPDASFADAYGELLGRAIATIV